MPVAWDLRAPSIVSTDHLVTMIIVSFYVMAYFVSVISSVQYFTCTVNISGRFKLLL